MLPESFRFSMWGRSRNRCWRFVDVGSIEYPIDFFELVAAHRAYPEIHIKKTRSRLIFSIFIFDREIKFVSSKKLEHLKVDIFETKKSQNFGKFFNWKSMKIDFQKNRDFRFSLISNWNISRNFEIFCLENVNFEVFQLFTRDEFYFSVKNKSPENRARTRFFIQISG